MSLTIALDAESLTLGPEESHFQLELTALVSPYIYVQRADRSKIILMPDGDPVKCYVLSHGDTIHFTCSNITVLVHMKPEDVQVESSPTQELVAPNNLATETIAPPLLNAVRTLDMSIPLEHVTETPMNDTIAESDAGDEQELDESYLYRLDLKSRRPSITTIVPLGQRKRLRDDKDEKEKPNTKKARQDIQDKEEPEVSAYTFPVVG